MLSRSPPSWPRSGDGAARRDRGRPTGPPGSESIGIDPEAVFEPHADVGEPRGREADPPGRGPAEVLPGQVRGLIRRTVGQVQAVDGVSFEVLEGGSLGLVGESGCGKSTTGRLVTRLLQPTGGSIRFDGQDIATISARRSCKPLRREIQMIFQDPYTSLNPRHTRGLDRRSPLEIHKVVPKKQVLGPGPGAARDRRAQPRALQPLPARVLRRPAAAHRHRPRAGPAARSCWSPTSRSRPSTCRSRPRWSTCCRTCSASSSIAFLFIAHDLAIVRHFCPEVAVMYLGKIVEIGDRDSIYLRRRTTPTPRRCSRRCPT